MSFQTTAVRLFTSATDLAISINQKVARGRFDLEKTERLFLQRKLLDYWYERDGSMLQDAEFNKACQAHIADIIRLDDESLVYEAAEKGVI